MGVCGTCPQENFEKFSPEIESGSSLMKNYFTAGHWSPHPPPGSIPIFEYCQWHLICKLPNNHHTKSGMYICTYMVLLNGMGGTVE